MKIQLNPFRRTGGSALVITLVVTGILGFSLASYLALVSFQNRSVVRSQIWNATIPLIEAGIEEALAHLNANGLTNIYTQGWRQQYGYAYKRRTMGEGRYTVAITPTARPIIECVGYLPKPALLSQSGQSFFAQFTYGYGSLTSNQVISRTVRVTVGGGALFPGGMIAKGSINMNGNGVSSDVFDSSDPNYSNPDGSYTPAKRKDKLNIDFPLVATNQGDGPAFDAGNADVYGGKTGTGPEGTLNTGPNSKIGGLAWMNDPTKTGIEPGYFVDDMNISFKEMSVPFSGGFGMPAGGTVTETNVSLGYGEVTTAVYPSPLPSGPITTNYGALTSYTFPTVFVPGSVTTSIVQQTSMIYPSNPLGPVTTNSTTVGSTTLPNPIPSSVSLIITNTSTLTTATLPSPLPSGSITTNAATTASSSRCTLVPMPLKTDPAPSWQPPSPGTYVGEIFNVRYVSTGSKDNKGWWHDYFAVASYTYTTKSYLITYSQAYSYSNYQYTYKVPESYTYTGVTATNTTVTTESYSAIFDSRDYQVSSLSGKIYIRGRARIHVTGSFSFTGSEGITIGPNGSLELYMSGESAKIGGNGILNKTGKAANFLYYGTPSNTSLELAGNGEFIGAIYAPEAAMTLKGGGSDEEDFIGACVVASVFMTGHFNFHYDEDLERRGPRSRYTITSWNEIGSTEARILGNSDWVYMDDSTSTTDSL